MKLFQITDRHSRKPLKDTYFGNKPAAKIKRKELNDAANDFRYYVSPGPDHRRFK